MDKRTWLTVALALLSVAAQAQSNYRPLEGAKELGLFGNWASVSGNNSTGIYIEGGYYVTRNLVAQVSLGSTKAGSEPTVSHIFPAARYEFNTSGQLVPYLMAGFSMDSGGGHSSSKLRMGFGANYYFRPSAAFSAELTFYRPTGFATVTSLSFGARIFLK
jgi:hypothetical protein